MTRALAAGSLITLILMLYLAFVPWKAPGW